MNPNWPLILLDENTSTPSGGAPASSQPVAPSEGAGASSAPPSQPQRMPDSPAEPPPQHDSFAGMEDNDFDLVEVPIETPTDGESGEAQPPPAAAQPQPATAAPPAAPQAAPAQQRAPAENAPSAPRSPLEQAIEGFRTNHNELSKWASTNLFALNKEDAEILETDAASFIPVLMGRVYSQALQATTNLMKNFVPDMINQGVATTTARTAKANEALQEFYAANSHLNAQQHGALVDKWARAFRAANPQASRSDAIKFVGNAVTAELGGTPSNTNGARPPRAAPFAPARPGTRVQTHHPQNDPYEGMDMDYDQE